MGKHGEGGRSETELHQLLGEAQQQPLPYRRRTARTHKGRPTACSLGSTHRPHGEIMGEGLSAGPEPPGRKSASPSPANSSLCQLTRRLGKVLSYGHQMALCAHLPGSPTRCLLPTGLGPSTRLRTQASCLEPSARLNRERC